MILVQVLRDVAVSVHSDAPDRDVEGKDVASTDRDRIAAVPQATPATVAPAVAGGAGDAASIAQVPLAQARRGAGVAEQGCLLSSYTG